MVNEIRRLCKEQKTSIAALEKKLGFGNGVIGRWDKSIPSYDRLLAVANALGVAVEDLTSAKDAQYNFPTPTDIKKDAPGPQAESDLERRFRAAAAKLPPDFLEREIAYLEQKAQQLHTPTDSDM